MKTKNEAIVDWWAKALRKDSDVDAFRVSLMRLLEQEPSIHKLSVKELPENHMWMVLEDAGIEPPRAFRSGHLRMYIRDDVVVGYTVREEVVWRVDAIDVENRIQVDGRDFTVALDFDGVIHSYVSGWQNTLKIADPPTPGAIEWLTELAKSARIIIHSSRLAFEKREFFHEETPVEHRVEAIRAWLARHGTPMAVIDVLEFHTGHGKPHATVYVDDRGYRFTGTFPSIEELAALKPWNK